VVNVVVVAPHGGCDVGVQAGSVSDEDGAGADVPCAKEVKAITVPGRPEAPGPFGTLLELGVLFQDEVPPAFDSTPDIPLDGGAVAPLPLPLAADLRLVALHLEARATKPDVAGLLPIEHADSEALAPSGGSM
jgi:hypothetical protein